MASPRLMPGKFLTLYPEPYTIPQALANATFEEPTLIGAIQDQRPEQVAPDGNVKLKPPVFPMIPSTVATNTGRGFCSDRGPFIGYMFTVVLHPDSKKVAKTIASNEVLSDICFS